MGGHEIINCREGNGGRGKPKTSTGRHGEVVKPKEKAPETGRGSKFSKRAGLVGGIILAAGLGFAACEDGKSKNVDAGVDSGLTGSELCTEEFTGQKWQALLRTGDKELIGPEGHYLNSVKVDFENQTMQVSFSTVQGEPIMTDGSSVEGEGVVFGYDENNKDIYITIGGVEQIISFCGFYNYEGEVYAFLQTDAVNGFFKCEFVEETVNSQTQHNVSSATVQNRTLTIAKEGFTPDEAYDPVDPACEDPEQLGGILESFVSEESTFTQGLDEATVPSTGLSYVNVRGGKYLVVSAGNAKVELVDELGSGTMGINETVTAEDNGSAILKVVYLGLDINGKHSFGANYEGASDGYVVVSEVEGEPNLRVISVLSETNPGVTIDEFVVRFEEFMSTDGTAVKASIYREDEVKQLKDEGVVALRSKEAPDEGSYEAYDIALTANDVGAVTGWTLTNN